MFKIRSYAQKGFTLVEVMVSTAVAAIGMAGAISIFANTVQSNTDSLQQIRLDQELRAIMNVMSRDIRRAGYWRDANGVDDNPFANNANLMTESAAESCFWYTYDADNNGAVSAGDQQGIRLINNAVNIIGTASSCADTSSVDDWSQISDSRTISITALNFNISDNACINASTDQRTCNTAIAGDVLRTMKVVTITLSGELAADSDVSDTLIETVTVRNTVSAVQS